ncbi:GNAT family N-acetyltransferase [Endozoicomonas atrinae]|uniref:GNAT family N-acetyltransferase n=1 Tax=Endozoicomonas atrinae TaxID=1333660 RepID=UPI0030835F09
MTFITCLTHTGSWRCLIEGVRVHQNFRSRGYGEAMFQYAIGGAPERVFAGSTDQ